MVKISKQLGDMRPPRLGDRRSNMRAREAIVAAGLWGTWRVYPSRVRIRGAPGPGRGEASATTPSRPGADGSGSSTWAVTTLGALVVTASQGPLASRR
jgi:hypothetical protein